MGWLTWSLRPLNQLKSLREGQRCLFLAGGADWRSHLSLPLPCGEVWGNILLPAIAWLPYFQGMFSDLVWGWTLSQAQCFGTSQMRCWSPSWPGAALCHSRWVLKPNPVQDSFQRKVLPTELNVPCPGASCTAPLQGMFLTVSLYCFAPAMGGPTPKQI